MEIEEKLVSALEKLTQVNRILLWDVSKRENLSPIQIQFLLYISRYKEESPTISKLAEEFGLTPATVSEAVNSLEEKGLLLREQSKKDGRVFTLKLTLAGKEAVKKIANWSGVLKKHIEKFPLQGKEATLKFLLELIKNLYESGVISVARLCFTCANFVVDTRPDSTKPYYCRLTNMSFSNSEVNVDCSGFTPKKKKEG
ncbi:MAG: winged helix-turn-helix transcriptional regulator [Caldiserica bacterium]|nr:winged helix-turn-helix transcriptional regulator [Caldisericota bacterium]